MDLSADDAEEIDVETFVLDLLILKTVKAEPGAEAAAGQLGTDLGMRVKAEGTDDTVRMGPLLFGKRGSKVAPSRGTKRKLS